MINNTLRFILLYFAINMQANAQTSTFTTSTKSTPWWWTNLMETTTPPAEGSCYNHFFKLGNRCYFFSEFILLTHSWEDARTYCRSFSEEGSSYDLLVMDSDIEEPILIRQEMSNRGYNNATIGAYSLGLASETWVWVDGVQLSMRNPTWDCGFPNSGISDAVAMLEFIPESLPSGMVNRLRIRDIASSTREYYICEGDVIYDTMSKY